MKKIRTILATALIASIAVLSACNNNPSSSTGGGSSSTSTNTGGGNSSSSTNAGGGTSNTTPESETDFYVTYKGEEIADGTALTIYVNDSTSILTAYDALSVTNELAAVSYASSNASVLAVDENTGLLNPLSEGTATITIDGGEGGVISLNFTVLPTTVASGVASYATASYEDKAEILAALEDYAVDNYLTGITLFSNGGYVAYNSRYTPTAREYVSGYGWGTMKEGVLSADLTSNEVVHPSYWNSGMSVLPTNSNAMDASGSDVSSIAGYYTASYYSTRLTSTNDSYEWYPQLALNLTDTTYPVAIDEESREPVNSQYNKRWRIYVRCQENSSIAAAPVYRTSSTATINGTSIASFNRTTVKLEDYLTPFRFMLTAWNQQYRGAEQTEGVSGFEGASAYFQATTARTSSDAADAIYNADLWNQYMGDTIKTGTDENGSYIEFKLLYDCTPFYAMYYLSSQLHSPLPESFVKLWGGDHFGKNWNEYGPADTMLSVGPYYIDTWSNSLVSLARNDDFFEYNNGQPVTLNDGSTRRMYQIPGFDFKSVASNETRSQFERGNVDSYGIQKDDLASSGDYRTDSGSTANINWVRYQTKGDANFKININATTDEEWNAKFGPQGTVYAHSTTSNEYRENHERPRYLSDDNFLNFMSFGLDRRAICESRGMTPTQEYFSDNYLIDPESGISYNATEAHRAVLADRYNTGTNPGYNETAAINALRAAFDNSIVPAGQAGELDTQNPNAGTTGTASNPYVVYLKMDWMNTTDPEDYGDVFDSWISIFNTVSQRWYGSAYVLEIDTPTPSSDYNVVYNKMKRGEYQLGFGAISGEELMPLHFFEVLKSDNSSDFTLNWGPDTSEVSPDIVYDGKTWSFDALWSAGNTVALLNSEGGLAEMTTVSNTRNSAEQSVTWELDLSQFISAGAYNFSLSASTPNATHSASWTATGEGSANQLVISDDGRTSITLDSGFNTDVDDTGTTVNNATVTLTLTFTIDVNGTATSTTAEITVSSYYGLTA